MYSLELAIDYLTLIQIHYSDESPNRTREQAEKVVLLRDTSDHREGGNTEGSE